MAKRGCLQTAGLIVGGIVVFGILGATLDRTDTVVREATTTPKIVMPTSTVIVVATEPVVCDTSAWMANTNEVYEMWGSAKTILELDGITSKYDSLVIPECNPKLIALDEQIRMGIAMQRTALMLDQKEAEKYVGQALIAYMQAGEILKGLNNE